MLAPISSPDCSPILAIPTIISLFKASALGSTCCRWSPFSFLDHCMVESHEEGTETLLTESVSFKKTGVLASFDVSGSELPMLSLCSSVVGCATSSRLAKGLFSSSSCSALKPEALGKNFPPAKQVVNPGSLEIMNGKAKKQRLLNKHRTKENKSASKFSHLL